MSECDNPSFFPVMLKYHVTDRAYRTDTQRINDSVNQMRKIHDGVQRAKGEKKSAYTREISEVVWLCLLIIINS